jgi:hypothetical protein
MFLGVPARLANYFPEIPKLKCSIYCFFIFFLPSTKHYKNQGFSNFFVSRRSK